MLSLTWTEIHAYNLKTVRIRKGEIIQRIGEFDTNVFVVRSGLLRSYAIFLAAITGRLADLGYFLFMDLGGYVHFVPGTVMPLVSSAAIILSFYVYFKSDKMTLLQE